MLISGYSEDNRPLIWEHDPELWLHYQKSLRTPRTYGLGHLNDRWAAKYLPGDPSDNPEFPDFEGFDSDAFDDF